MPVTALAGLAVKAGIKAVFRLTVENLTGVKVARKGTKTTSESSCRAMLQSKSMNALCPTGLTSAGRGVPT